MSEEITLEEVLRLVSFENFDGGWAVKDVRGDVRGDAKVSMGRGAGTWAHTGGSTVGR